MWVELRPVGVVRVRLSDEEVREAWRSGGVEGEVEVYPEYEPALEGIEGFSHLRLVVWLHKVGEGERGVLRVRPRRWLRLGVPEEEVPEVGVFCTDSPHRPNPVGMTVVRLEERRGRLLRVSGLDLFDGTPVLDIRPHVPRRILPEPTAPEWFRRLQELAEKLKGTPE